MSSADSTKSSAARVQGHASGLAHTAAAPVGQKNVLVLPQPVPKAPKLAPPAESIGAFIELQAHARAAATLEALKFVIANGTRRLALYDQAYLLEPEAEAGWRVVLAASVSKFDRNAPMIRSIEKWASMPREQSENRIDGLHAIELPDLGAGADLAPSLKFGLWVPIKSRNGKVVAVLLALRQQGWLPEYRILLAPLAGAYGHAWEALAPGHVGRLKKLHRSLTARRVAWTTAAAIALSSFIPVPLTALAPAEIVAAAPSVVAAPIDGVVRDILVSPGTMVKAGTPLVQFVDTKLRNDRDIALKAKSVAELRYFKALQSALSVHKDLEEIGIAQGEIAVATAELNAADEMLSRTEVKADKDGLAIFSSPTDWIGKPVQIGERIMEIGDPANVEMRIDLPVSDAVALKLGSPVGLFLDGDPLRQIAASVARIAYRPMLSPEQQMIYRVYARFNDGKALRIGLRGTARVSGDQVSLWYFLLRRPLSSLRQRIGF